MTSITTEPASPAPRPPEDDRAHDTSAAAGGRALFRVAALLTILPVVVAAIRNGVRGWFPVGDAATTAVRANDVFSHHFPLVGMWSTASSWAGRPIRFPGALQLYVMSIPMKLFGNSWGVLIGVATINVACLLTTCWLIRRRVGYRTATLACAFLASFTWTLGSEVLIDMTPMQMVTVPCMLLFTATWAVGDGDLVALPILAFVANYLFLDHLTLTALVPIMVVTALVLLATTLRRHRREDRATWPAERLRALRWSGLALLITVAAWTPPLIQNFTGSPPHNLTNLYEASKISPPHVVPLGHALRAVTTVVAAPPWWLRPTFSAPAFSPDGSGRPLALLITSSIVLAAIYAGAVLAARRRRDHTLAVGLLSALATVLAVAVTTKKSTNPIGLLSGYLHSLWVSAVFVWMLVAIAAVRLLPRPRFTLRRDLLQGLAVAITATWCVLALPVSNQESGTPSWAVAPARTINDQAIPKLRDKGTVLLPSVLSLEEGTIQSSLILALQEADIPFVLTGTLNIHQFGENRAFRAAPPNAQVVAYVTNSTTAPEGSTLIASAPADPLVSAARLEALDREVRAWATRRGRPRIASSLRRDAPGLAAQLQTSLDQAYDTAQRTGTSLTSQAVFQDLALGSRIAGHEQTWLDTTGIDEGDLRLWALARYNNTRHSFYVYVAPLTATTPQ